MAELRVEPELIIDLGDRCAQRLTLAAVGLSSSVAIRETRGNIVYVSPRGLIARPSGLTPGSQCRRVQV